MTNGEESDNADRRIQWLLTKSRLVHGIDSALNLQTYDRFEIPETEKKKTGVIKDKSSAEETYFTNNPQNVLNVGCVSRQHNQRSFCFEECCI